MYASKILFEYYFTTIFLYRIAMAGTHLIHQFYCSILFLEEKYNAGKEPHWYAVQECDATMFN